MATKTKTKPTRRCGSHDHIIQTQKLTGGVLLAAGHVRPRAQDLWRYDGRRSKPGWPPAYFINGVFPTDIVGANGRVKPNRRRDRDDTLNPGYRHDLLLDLEKKRQDEDGVYYKDQTITDDEKAALIAVLKKLPWVAWAGVTPHGVHAGVYLSGWMAIGHSRRLVVWVGEELKKAGYAGPLEIDVPPSVNSNRPSRFLERFAFFRPSARLDFEAILGARNA